MLKLIFIMSDTSRMCHVLANLDQHFWQNFSMSRVVRKQEISNIRSSCDNAPESKQMEIKQLSLFNGWKPSSQKRTCEDNLRSFRILRIGWLLTLERERNTYHYKTAHSNSFS